MWCEHLLFCLCGEGGQFTINLHSKLHPLLIFIIFNKEKIGIFVVSSIIYSNEEQL